MSVETLRQAFAHHLWANLVVIDAVSVLDDVELDSLDVGNYGSILSTLRHIVGGDLFYLNILAGDETLAALDVDDAELSTLRTMMIETGARWRAFLTEDLDESAVIEENEDDGFRRWAPVSLRLIQAIQHGTDHRSQICTSLTRLGNVPPNIDVWAFGLGQGSIIEIDSPRASN